MFKVEYQRRIEIRFGNAEGEFDKICYKKHELCTQAV